MCGQHLLHPPARHIIFHLYYAHRHRRTFLLQPLHRVQKVSLADATLLKQDSNDPSTTNTTADGSSTGSVPPPLNIPPSRARRQLAARLAQRKQAAEAAETTDPDAADQSAVETAHTLPEEPSELESLGPATEAELREAGLHIRSGKGRFGGTFSSDEDSSDDELELGGKGQDDSARFGRRPSTTEAKERRPLDDEDDAVDLARNASSDEDDEQLVEIKPRRTSES